MFDPSSQPLSKRELDFALNALRICADVDRLELEHRNADRLRGLSAAQSSLRLKRWRLAAWRFKDAVLRYAQQEIKAGFDPSQPRWPAGSGVVSGRWSSGSKQPLTDVSAARRLGSRPHGHHYLPHAFYSKLPLREDTRKVFDEAKTGRLYGQRHVGGKDHDIYSEAAIEKFNQFMTRNSISPEQMTPAQARVFIQEIMSSRDPRIYNYNIKIWRREILYILRFGARRPE